MSFVDRPRAPTDPTRCPRSSARPAAAHDDGERPAAAGLGRRALRFLHERLGALRRRPRPAENAAWTIVLHAEGARSSRQMSPPSCCLCPSALVQRHAGPRTRAVDAHCTIIRATSAARMGTRFRSSGSAQCSRSTAVDRGHGVAEGATPPTPGRSSSTRWSFTGGTSAAG